MEDISSFVIPALSSASTLNPKNKPVFEELEIGRAQRNGYDRVSKISFGETDIRRVTYAEGEMKP